MRLLPERLASCRAALLLAAAAVLAGCATVSLDEPIESHPWRLASIDGQAVPPASDARQQAQLEFDGNGRVAGSGGCNRLTGSYQRNGTQLKIGPLASTRMACVDPTRGQLESRFLAALEATTQYSVVGGELVLIGSRGQTLAKLSSASR
ncbi:META domain-containing protein [Variovorax dokdonensis]|uniref:META domain-containing protein n=1 Tax=Variovorax dokdonensis TaxID=344883 RepID=A0ABT7N9S3_9BURK|nr:META domain-containing protein [Variovorax dokdonensis]MDM0044701.1 META domain-containing protein [Variovorax dokdonensis]